MKQILLLLIVAVFASCSKDDQDEAKITGYKEYSMTIASQKLQGVVGIGVYVLQDVYAVKKEASTKWEPFIGIQGFDYESGFEYVIKISETNYLDYRRGDPAWSEYKLIEVSSKEKKNSEGLPEHFIPDWYAK